MAAPLTIGDFSRATFLSVKTLRHYHSVGLPQPADVDENTGYRRYTVDQIPTAEVIPAVPRPRYAAGGDSCRNPGAGPVDAAAVSSPPTLPGSNRTWPTHSGP